MAPHKPFPTSRTDAPAYLMRYLARRASKGPGEPSYSPERGRPPYIDRARARAAMRARQELAREAPPPGGRSEAYAQVTVSPREIVAPTFMKDRLAGSVDIRLIRHGQTQSYATESGVTPLGRWQAHRKGQNLARGVRPGMTIRIPHAPTARAMETALALREGLLQGMARYHVEATVEEPYPDPHFLNFKMWTNGAETDITQAFVRYATMLEDYERHQGGDRPSWMVEMDRFWKIQAAGGDPITHWLTMPLQFMEPPALVVRRFWRGMATAVAKGPEDLRVFVCTHSGPIRAVATAAFGHDPGEPHHVEDVRIRMFADFEHAIVTYRGRGLEVEVPSRYRPSWSPMGPYVLETPPVRAHVPRTDVLTYFNFRSPYCYLASKTMWAIEDDYPGRIIFKPLPGWAGRSPPERARVKLPLARQDVRRWCRRLNIPFVPPPRTTDPTPSARVSLVAEKRGKLRAYVGELMAKEWGEGVDIGRRDAVLDVGTSVGLDPTEVAAALDDPSYQAVLDQNQRDIEARGIFGVPTFVIGDEIFWGQDRIDFVCEHLAESARADSGGR